MSYYSKFPGLIMKSRYSFSPSDISGMQLWLDAADPATISETGGQVSQWRDKSTNAKNGTQAASASRPITGTRPLNGKNGLDFDGSKWLDMPDDTFTYSPGTDFAVYLPDNVTQTSGIIGNSNLLANGRRFIQNQNVNYGSANLNVAASSGVPVLQMSAVSGTGSATQTIRVNNISNTGAVTRAGIAAGTCVGALVDGTSNFFDGVIYEIISYNRVLTDAEKDQVGNYLAAKYNLSWLSVNAPNASVAAFGDSITEGQNASTTPNRWANMVAATYGSAPLNQGIAGTYLQNTPLNNSQPGPNNGRDRYAAALTGANKRDKVYILYGVNDIRNFTVSGQTNLNVNDYQIDLDEIVVGLLVAGYTTADIFLGSPPYYVSAANPTLHAQYVAAVRAVAVARGVRYANVYQYMIDNGGASLMSGDNLHPNDAGHAAIAQAFSMAGYVT